MTPTNLSVADLRELLEQGRPVTVLDIRAAGDREWSIAGGGQVVQVRRTGKGCLSYIVASDGEAAVIDAFTGDTLFVSGVARPDLEEAPSGSVSQARLLHRSVHRLLELPATTLVLPGRLRTRFRSTAS